MTYSCFKNLVVIIIILVGFQPCEFNHMTYSCFENLIVIMIMLVQIEPYVMILLLLRLLSSTWFYTLDFQWLAFFLNFISFLYGK